MSRVEAGIAERESIVSGAGLDTIRRLFSVSLKLQALASNEPDSDAAQPLHQCVHELDVAISDVRALVFAIESHHD